MRCETFELRLNELLDQRLPLRGDERLVEHGRDCEPCANLLAQYEMLFRGLKHSPQPVVPARFAQRVVADVTGPVGRRWWSPVYWGPALAVAAAVLVMISWRNHHPGAARGNHTVETIATSTPTLPRQRAVTPVSTAELERLTRQAEQMMDHHLTIAGQVADGLKPLGDSVSAALNALRRTLPSGDVDTRPAPQKSSFRSPDHWVDGAFEIAV